MKVKVITNTGQDYLPSGPFDLSTPEGVLAAIGVTEPSESEVKTVSDLDDEQALEFIKGRLAPNQELEVVHE